MAVRDVTDLYWKEKNDDVRLVLQGKLCDPTICKTPQAPFSALFWREKKLFISGVF